MLFIGASICLTYCMLPLSDKGSLMHWKTVSGWMSKHDLGRWAAISLGVFLHCRRHLAHPYLLTSPVLTAPAASWDLCCRPKPHTKRWNTHGTIVEVGAHHHYFIRLTSGRVWRRNRRFIRRLFPVPNPLLLTIMSWTYNCCPSTGNVILW